MKVTTNGSETKAAHPALGFTDRIVYRTANGNATTYPATSTFSAHVGDSTTIRAASASCASWFGAVYEMT